MSDERTETVITKGSARSIEIRLEDENGQPESLVGATAATLTVRETLSSTTAVLERKTSAANLSIDIPGAKLVATISQVEADALPPGIYVAEAAVQIGGVWLHTDAFFVRIVPGMAPHS